jgi:hypothetical protein
MKQTAVEWLYSRMFDKNSILTKEEYYKVKKAYYKAKEMEKEQIEDAYINGLWENAVPFFTNYQAEQYYNETFKDSPLK